MKRNPSKEKIVNTQDDHGTGQIDATISANTVAKKPNNETEKKTKFTQEDLKGKKVDGDPELESDQPVDQLH